MRNSIILAIFILILGGCSSGPVRNGDPVNPIPQFSGNPLVGVTESFPDGTPAAGFGVMGLFDLYLNPGETTAEIHSQRSGALTDTLEVVDITNFLSLAPCTDCVKIKSIALDPDGNLVVSLGIKHPFPAGDPFKPISGKNRADLHVFNVEGILEAQTESNTAFPDIHKTVSSVKMVNASGYTSYLDSVLDSEVFSTDADLHPYILHFADYTAGNYNPSSPTGFESVTDPGPSGNLVMAMGCEYDYRDYVFDLEEPVTYSFAVGCTYAVSSASKAMRFTPEYRVPQHLKKAASEVHVVPPTELLKETDPDFEVTMQVQVVDPSHGIAVGDGLDQMFADSSVASVTIEIPGVITGSKTQPGSAVISGIGHDPSDPLVYDFTFSNEQSALEGFYPGLVRVLDTYSPGLNQSPLLNGMDGIKRVGPIENPLVGLFSISEFVTYAAFEIQVEMGFVGSDPVANIIRSNTGCYPVTVSFDASGSTDADDDPLSIPLNFEFDFDYDGTTFTIDRAMSTDPLASHLYNIPGCYTAAVRVTDSHMNQVIATVVVPIGSFDPIGTDADVTDGSSITDIDYTHAGATFVPDLAWPGTTYPVKGTARGNGYVYTAFYGVQGGNRSIFFARSSDDGGTWETPVTLHTYDSYGQYAGCSITADNTGQVIVVWVDRCHRDVVIEYSTDSGDTFNSNIIRDETDCNAWCMQYRTPDVAIDPTNPNNIIVSTMYVPFYSGSSWGSGGDQMYVCYSSTGPGGTFSEVFYVTGSEWRPGWVQNIYKVFAFYAIDGDAYVIAGENNNIHVFRSLDSGITWSVTDPNLHMINTINTYHRHYDAAMDTLNPEVFYVTAMRHSFPYSIELYKSTDGLTVTMVQSKINDSSSTAPKLAASVTVNDAGVVYVMWHTNESGNYQIMGDYSCNSGSTFSTDVVFNTVDNGNEVDPDLTPNICGDGVVCVWERNDDQPSGKLVSRRG